MGDTRTTAASLKRQLQAPLPDLYHYTCEHARPLIEHTGHLVSSARMLSQLDIDRDRLITNRTASIASQVVWLTTLPNLLFPGQHFPGRPVIETDCKRTEVRVQAKADCGAVPWLEVRSVWPAEVVRDLESVPHARPHTWWISGGIVPVAGSVICQQDDDGNLWMSA